MKLMLGRMPGHDRYRGHEEEMRYGRAESYWRDDLESRRGRRTRSEWDDAENRRTRSEWDGPENRRTRSEWADEAEARRRGRGARGEWADEAEARRRGRSARGEWDDNYESRMAGYPADNARPRSMTVPLEPWEHWGGGEARRIGYAAEHEEPRMAAEHQGGSSAAQHGMAVVKELTPDLEGVLEDSVKVLQSPPQTWPAYLHRKDYAGIVKMEAKELLNALEAKKSVADMRKELTHTIAALFKLAMS